MKIGHIAATLLLFFGMAACGNSNTQPESIPVSDSPYFKSSDELLKISGVDIRYRDEGPKDKPVIVMIHGFTSSLETWDAVANPLKTDYRIIRFDLPGHGLSGEDASGDYSNARTVEIAIDFLEALGLSRVTLVGNSLGGLTAWRAASAQPDLVSRLVLISPGGFSINGVTEKPVPVPMMVKIYLTKAPSAGVAAATKSLYGDPSKLLDARLQEIEAMMEQPGNGDALLARAEQFTLPAPETDLAKVDVPTLLIWGDKDAMVPPSHGQKFVDVMPKATLKTYSGIGHVPQEEVPNRLSNDIKDFMSNEVTP